MHARARRHPQTANMHISFMSPRTCRPPMRHKAHPPNLQPRSSPCSCENCPSISTSAAAPSPGPIALPGRTPRARAVPKHTTASDQSAAQSRPARLVLGQEAGVHHNAFQIVLSRISSCRCNRRPSTPISAAAPSVPIELPVRTSASDPHANTINKRAVRRSLRAAKYPHAKVLCQDSAGLALTCKIQLLQLRQLTNRAGKRYRALSANFIICASRNSITCALSYNPARGQASSCSPRA